MSDGLVVARKGLLKPDGSEADPDTGVRRLKATIWECRNLSAEGVEPVYKRENPTVLLAPYNMDALCRELAERKAPEGTARALTLEMVADNDDSLSLQTVYDGDFDAFMAGMARQVKSPQEVMQAIHATITRMGQMGLLSHALVTLGFKDPVDEPVKTAGFAFHNIHLKPTDDDDNLVGDASANFAKAFANQLERREGPPDKVILKP